MNLMAHPLLALKTTSRNVQRSGLLYRLFVKYIITHKQSSVASLLKKREDCIISFRKSSFPGSSEFSLWCLTPADHCLVFPPQSNVAFINSKNCSGFAVSILLSALNKGKHSLVRIARIGRKYSLRYFQCIGFSDIRFVWCEAVNAPTLNIT